MKAARVFYIGETVPAGTCVLTSTGEVFVLGETGHCDDNCDDLPIGERCPKCSYEVTNLYSGPLVEVQLPDYTQAVAAEDARRAQLANSASGGAR